MTLASYLAELHDQGRVPASVSTAVAAARFPGPPRRRAEPSRRTDGLGPRRLPADRRRPRPGQVRPFGAADLAAVLATCHQPRRPGRGFESDQATTTVAQEPAAGTADCQAAGTDLLGAMEGREPRAVIPSPPQNP